MTTAPKLPNFLSIRWKGMIVAGALVSLILALLSWHLSHRYQKISSQELRQLQSRNIETLEVSIYRDGEALLQHVNNIIGPILLQQSISTKDRPPNTNEALSLQNLLIEIFEHSQPALFEQWGVTDTFLLGGNNEILEHWHTAITPSNGAVNESNSETEPAVLEKLLVQNHSATASVHLVCHHECRQVVVKRLFQNNSSQNNSPVGVVVISRPFDYLAQQYYRSARSHLGVIGLVDATTPTGQSIDTPAESVDLENWRAQLLTIWPGNQFVAALKLVGEKFSLAELTGSTRAFRFQDQHFAINILPLRNSTGLRFVLLNDITNVHANIVDQLFKDSVVMITLLGIFFAYVAFVRWRYVGRITQQLRLLPMLGKKKYNEVREIISQNKSFHLYHDEFDDLDNSVTALTYQLESLEKAVSNRTREMERLSLFDTLTGLANRNLFLYELERDVQRFQQQGGMLAVVILDLDKFKRINDTLGHQPGDILLGKIGSRLRTATRTLGLVARLGGDEFAVILRSAKKFAQLEVLCQKILDLVHKPINLDGHNVMISCSLGVSLAGTTISANDLVRHAEIAMYKAKESGGNGFRVFSATMATEAHANLSLEAEIRRAFDQREFTLYLQPKVNMDSQIEGFESLVRWDHPDRGILPPNEFIPAMENMGLISRLDNFILDSSCRQLKVLNQHFPDVSIAVNIASTHFTDKNFLLFLKSCLNQYPIKPERLELEITETLLMENMDVGMEIIQQIKDLGVSIAIDDFGTGYSSLSYLKKLPVDTIKIDREFIKDIPDSESDMQISSVIIFLAQQLNFKVVAEGVETTEQLAFLKSNDCDLAQGFLFSKPIPAHKAMLLLESQRRDKKYNIG